MGVNFLNDSLLNFSSTRSSNFSKFCKVYQVVCFLYFFPFLLYESEILDSFVTVFVDFKEKNSYANIQIKDTMNIINDE